MNRLIVFFISTLCIFSCAQQEFDNVGSRESAALAPPPVGGLEIILPTTTKGGEFQKALNSLKEQMDLNTEMLYYLFDNETLSHILRVIPYDAGVRVDGFVYKSPIWAGARIKQHEIAENCESLPPDDCRCETHICYDADVDAWFVYNDCE